MNPADADPAPARSQESPTARRSWLSLSLPAKILACFLLNLLLFAGVGVFFLQGQFHFGLDSLLAGRSGERLQAMSEVVVTELNGHPRAEWADILKRFADAYQVQIAAVRNDGSRLAGTITDPPARVLAKLSEGDAGRGPLLLPPMLGPRDGPGAELQPGSPRNAPGSAGRLDGGAQGALLPPPPESRGAAPPLRNDGTPRREVGPPPGWPPREGPQPPGRSGGPPAYPKFILHDGTPPVYWIGVRVPLQDDEGRRGPGSLLIVLPALGSGGLLLDVTPWLVVGAAVLAISVLLWLPLVRGITRSIRQMTGAAAQMAQGQFGTRVDTARRDELGRLGESLNHMAGRLGEYVTGQKRFLGDIAHELCSPLARMEMALGVLEQQSGEQQQGYVNDVREEVRHMSSLVNELLSFTKAGLRSKEIELRPVALADVCARVIAREAHDRADLALNVHPGLKVLADPDLLARAIANVLRNAVRYAGNAGTIVVTATSRNGEVILSVADRGPGVPKETLHRLFDPFYRPESARTREGGGTGLGLAIVKSCVEACGGSVEVKNAEPSGLEVTMTLRRAS
jgi:two-component system sensor histidine kinase CpxA